LDKRIKKIFKNSEEKPDLILLKNSSEPFIDTNFFYATGLSKGLFENCAAILYPDGKLSLVISNLEEESAKKANSEYFSYKTGKEFNEIMKKFVTKDLKIGINFSGLTHSSYLNLKKNFPTNKFIDISNSLDKTRIIKDDLEIKELKKACSIVDRIVEKIPSFIQQNMTESELAAEINYHMQKFGAEKPAFDTISSFGKNSAEPHYTHGEVKLKKGDFVLCDFGACVNKYNSDITRTFVFGNANKEQKEIYEIVKEAQKIGIDEIKSGVIAKDVHNKVSSFIDETKYKGKFIHSTGHSLGLDVHDLGGGLNQNSEIELRENMVFTVEPGIYVAGMGGVRIEDDILVKPNNVELLTNSKKNFIEI
jgi:Xaa-Pro dipeptidase